MKLPRALSSWKRNGPGAASQPDAWWLVVLCALGCTAGKGREAPRRSEPEPAAAQGSAVVPSQCFEGPALRNTWVMDRSLAKWNPASRRFEQGSLHEGQREGCWYVWYEDGTFDSAFSGVYQHGVKIASAPTPPGDYEGEY